MRKTKYSSGDILWLILDNLNQGVALLKGNFRPLSVNSLLKSICKEFGLHERAGRFPSPLIKCLKELRDTGRLTPPPKSLLTQIAAPNGKTFFVTCKSLSLRGDDFYLFLVHAKRLREFEIYEYLNRKHGITAKQFKVILCVMKGQRNDEIAESLKISSATVKAHVKEICLKMGVSGTKGLVAAINEING